jgi:hypothetical protein
MYVAEECTLFKEYRGTAPNLEKCNIFMREVQPLCDKHNTLKIKEYAVLYR